MRKAAILVALVAAGCTVGPDYAKPDQPAPRAWSVHATGDVAVRWWSLFKDPVLDRLVERAVEANLDLRIARGRIREARAQAVAAGARLWPSLDASADPARVRSSRNGGQPDVGQDFEHGLYRAGFDAIWEIDLFGGTRRAVEAAEADVESAEEERRDVLVSLLGELARSYVEFRGATRQLAVLRDNVRASREVLDLTRRRLEGGIGTALDVARAESLVAETEAEIPTVETSRRRAMHRIGVLLGRDPLALDEELRAERPIPAAPERIGAGLPSELLSRRPDVRRAERRLAAATARVGVATAELYPKFSLVGSLGLESIDASDFLGASSRLWSIGPSLRFPIFQGRKLEAGVEAAEARVEQAAAGYEKSFLAALEEVENALIAWAQEVERRRKLASAVDANRRAVELSRELFTKGLVAFLDVLEAERRLYATQIQIVRSEAAVAANATALYKALGGGWQEESR
jgi:NodT family efflux transporter outer membrane factor (OMF) lipoprotein